MVFILIWFFSFNTIYCERISLKDGTVIYGDFEGEIDNYLIIRTKYGVLTVSKSDILDSSSQPAIPEDVSLRIVIESSTDTYLRRFYEGDLLKATQVISKDGVIISSDGYIKDGIYYEYDDKGNIISERVIKDGIENGPLVEYYDDGKVKARIDYHNGKIHGKAIFYTLESKPMLEQTYSNGVLDGFSIEYDIEGNIKTKVLYSNGRLVDSMVKSTESGDVEVSSQVLTLKGEKKRDEVEVRPDLSTRIVKIARGRKVFVYLKNRYIGSFTYDKDYNIIDITGKILDGFVEVDEDGKKVRFEFLSNWPVSMTIFEKGIETKKFLYDENGRVKK